MIQKHVSMGKGPLGAIKATEQRIDLEPGTKPVGLIPYRQVLAMREHTKDETKKKLTAGVTEAATSSWVSFVVFVPEKDDTQRICVSYRRPNTKMLLGTYPPPRKDGCIDFSGDAAVFFTLHFSYGYR